MAANNGKQTANGHEAFDWDSFDGDAFLREHRKEWREETGRFQKDWKWFIKNSRRLAGPERRWIAICGERVVAEAPIGGSLRDALLAQGIEPGKALRVVVGGQPCADEGLR